MSMASINKMNEAAPSRSPMAKLPEFARIAEKVEKTSGLPFPKSIELIETPPCTNLTHSNENMSHSLEIERFITTKHQNKSTKLYTECLHGRKQKLRPYNKTQRTSRGTLTSTRRPKRRPT